MTNYLFLLSSKNNLDQRIQKILYFILKKRHCCQGVPTHTRVSADQGAWDHFGLCNDDISTSIHRIHYLIKPSLDQSIQKMFYFILKREALLSRRTNSHQSLSCSGSFLARLLKACVYCCYSPCSVF